MRDKIVLVDMDGVICDFEKGIQRVNPLITFNSELYHVEEENVNTIVKNDPTFFQNLIPIEDGVESVKILMDYYKVIFCSTPMEEVPHSFTGKKIWLNQHFGEKAYKNLTLTHHKNLCIGHYLIDDRLKNGAGEFTGEHIHYGTEKFPNWKRVMDYLIK